MEELAELEAAEKEQEEALLIFLNKLPGIGRKFFERLSDGLQLTEPSETITVAEARSRNMRFITRYRLQVRYMLTEAGYDDAVQKLMESMAKVTLQIESYYDKQGMTTSGELPRLARERLEAVRKNLIDIVPEIAFVEPVSEVLQNVVMRGTGIADLRKQLRARLTENNRAADRLPARQTYQIAHDALWMYHRNYSVSLGEQLGLTHYYYDGVAVAHSREFCLQRKGRAYTKKEIESWAKLEWQGKIPGTTKESIFHLCGGYNCIDVLRPITKTLYNQLSNQQPNNN